CGERAHFEASACSRAPDPTINSLTYSKVIPPTLRRRVRLTSWGPPRREGTLRRRVRLTSWGPPPCGDHAGETGFPPSPLPQSGVWGSLGSDNSDGRSESGLPSDASNFVPPPCGEGREGVPERQPTEPGRSSGAGAVTSAFGLGRPGGGTHGSGQP